MKSVLLSIQPKWCEKKASGEKTIEVRKTRPKIETPFKCYIYETKDTRAVRGFTVLGRYRIGKVIGEFVCDSISTYDMDGLEFYNMKEQLLKLSCLTESELLNYVGEKVFYGLHISDLKIYDKPKELGEFLIVNDKCEKGYSACAKQYCGFYPCERKRLTRPPQSWCYVEEIKE